MLDARQLQHQLEIMRQAAARPVARLSDQAIRARDFGEALAAAIDAGAFGDPRYAPLLAGLREGIRCRDYEAAVIAPLGHYLFGRRANPRQQFAAIIAAIEQQLADAEPGVDETAAAAPASPRQPAAAAPSAEPVRDERQPSEAVAGAEAQLGQPPDQRRARVGRDAARAEAERILREQGDRWPGLNELARQVRCAKGTILKAIDRSPYLQACQHGGSVAEARVEADGGAERPIPCEGTVA